MQEVANEGFNILKLNAHNYFIQSELSALFTDSTSSFIACTYSLNGTFSLEKSQNVRHYFVRFDLWVVVVNDKTISIH